jgi:hypothetical protein
MAFSIWSDQFQGKKVILHTDNEALVAILNSKTSKSKLVMQLLTSLVLQGLLHNILFKGQYIEVAKNIKADSLFRQQWSRFTESFPGAGRVVNTGTSGISTADLRYRSQELLNHALANNTKKLYSSGLRAFNNFRTTHNCQLIWPPTPSQLTHFIAFFNQIIFGSNFFFFSAKSTTFQTLLRLS